MNRLPAQVGYRAKTEIELGEGTRKRGRELSTIIYLTNQAMIPESGITRRRQSKNVHRLPFFLSRPHTELFFFSPYTPLGSLFTGYCFTCLTFGILSILLDHTYSNTFSIQEYTLFPSVFIINLRSIHEKVVRKWQTSRVNRYEQKFTRHSGKAPGRLS